MKFFPDRQTLISVGPLEIKYYAVFILLGAIFAYAISARNLKKKGYSKEIAEDLFFGALLSGILGARLWYVVFYDLSSYLQNPIQIFNFMQGGLAIHGGLFFGVLYGYYFAKKRKLQFLHLADQILYTVLVAQALGRWGNFMNQEAFGPVVDESFFALLPTFIKEGMLIAGHYRMPTFLMESALNVFGFLVIHFGLHERNQYKKGDLVYAYLIWYGIVRFYIESFRTDYLPFFGTGLKIAQVTSVAFIVVGLIGYFGVIRKIFKTKKPIIIYDFDGTLMDTESNIKQAFIHVLKGKQLTMDLSEEVLDSFIGPTLVESFRKVVDNPNIDELISQYRQIAIELHPTTVKPMDHAMESLKDLKAQGYCIAIASNKKTEMIKLALDQTGMLEYIDLFIGPDNVEYVKPDKRVVETIVNQLDGYHDNVIFVGDSVVDIETGINANAYTIGFTTNGNRVDQLINAKPNRMIQSIDEINSIVKEERQWIYYSI
ncbi:MAG: prolipoprotein diacylglyceryl transferase [Erysipelothrix sp.]|nr:prolipoprotein diacylglyceryl transferase [Erysipelothrix sp.]